MNTWLSIVFFVSGSYAFGLLLCGLLFYRFYRKLRAPLFLTFAITFELMFLEKVLLLAFGQELAFNSSIYLMRLFGFVLILWGIWNHNRADRAPRLRSVTMGAWPSRQPT